VKNKITSLKKTSVLDTIHAIYYWLITCGVYHKG